MASPTLAEIRAKLAAAQQKKETGGSSYQDNTVYPFWDIPEGKVATVRFLPDLADDAEYFWRERMVIRLAFRGVAGGDENKEVTVTVPCMNMWKDDSGKMLSDPILAATKDWWDDADLKPLAQKYWKKRSYVFQGFVVENPLDEKNAPENPIRRLIVNPSIFTIIKDSLMDPQMAELPTDFVHGRDFQIKKTRRGEYADYTTSNWKFNPRALTSTELEALEKYKLFNLKDFLPQRPSEAHQKAIMEMFEASVNGELYDQKRWGDFYRPSGMGFNKNAETTDDVVTPPAKTEEVVVAPVVQTEVATPVTSSTSAAEALAKLRAKATETAGASVAPSTTETTKPSAAAVLDMIKRAASSAS